MKKCVYSCGCIKIPMSSLIKEHYLDITNQLRFSQYDYNTGEKITHEFFKEEIFNLYIPRFFPLQNYNLKIKDNNCIGKDIDIQDKIELRDDIQIKAVNSLLKFDNGILKLPPGKGKTVIAIKFISTLKKKSLIYVDSEKLKNQWIDRLIQFTNLGKDNIGIIQGDKWELDKFIVIAMIQTVSNRVKKDFNKIRDIMYNANFGITIMDEVHVVVGPEQFTNCSFVSTSKRVYGLSATPTRTDNRDKLLLYCIGNIIYENQQYEITPKINVIKFDSGLSKSKTNKYICFGGKFSKLRYMKMLIKNHQYNNIINEIIDTCIKKNRNMVLISDIKKILEHFYNQYIDKYNKDKVGYFVGGSDNKEMTKQIVFTTYKLTGKAIDYPKWDTLIMLTPVASPITIEQSIGRITRKYEGKESSVVFDLVDLSYPLYTVKWFNNRKEFYNKIKSETKEIFKGGHCG